MKSIAQRKLADESKRRTQVALAGDLGISQPTLHELMNTDGRTPSWRVLVAAEKLLGITAREWGIADALGASGGATNGPG